MKEFGEMHTGDISLVEDLKLTGMVSGNVLVPSGKHLGLEGMVSGNVVVEPGGRASIRGLINGTLINQGAVVTVYGTVAAISDSAAPKTVVDPKARVGKKAVQTSSSAA